MEEKLRQLFNRKNWTDEEKLWLLTYLDKSDTTELKSIMQRHFEEQTSENVGLSDTEFQDILNKVLSRIDEYPVQKKGLLRKMPLIKLAAAASVIGLIVFSWIYFKNNEEKSMQIAEVKGKEIIYKNDVPPGGNKAILTLSDGTNIILDEAKNGDLAQQGNTKVIKINGKLEYDRSGNGVNEVLYNTISTPRGGQYQIELSDGSQVWLNSASSLRFPASFSGKERRVEITGEAYFEVEKNPSMPFIVSVNSSEIEVLGTHFNVMAYDDETQVKTTLLEGAVKFVNGSTVSRLTPGQQSVLSSDGSVKVLSGINVKEVVAWKDGMFYFENASMYAVMKQLERWYDVEVVYQRKNEGDLLHAEIPRNTRLSDVLKVFEMAEGAKFEIQGGKIIVK